MQIDWFTAAAQAINFLILVWLLKRFLYQPILAAIDARERQIARVLADADEKNREALQERDTFQRKNRELDQQLDLRLKQITEQVETTRQKWLDDARVAADSWSAKRHAALQREQQNLGDEFSRRARTEVFAITRRTLRDLADTSLEQAMSNVFIQRLRELDGEAKQALAVGLTASSDPARVRSAFQLPTEQQAVIRKTVRELFDAETPIQFETAPDVIAGIELTVGGRHVSWSIDDYLKSLAKSISVPVKGSVTLDCQIEAGSEPVS
jgi:F-type H+-transporting ATPase subunit b